MKKQIVALCTAILSATALFAGCFVTSGVDGKDGKDGTNASVYDYYELAKQENPNLTIDEFLKEYLNYTAPSEIDESLLLKARMNYSLLSGVSVVTQFTETNKTFGGQTITQTSTSFGSGVLVEKTDNGDGTYDGYVITNCHVVYNDASVEKYSNDIYLFLYGMDDNYDDASGRFQGELIGASITYDIAVIKVTDCALLKNAVPASFSGDDDVYVGEDVYAIGNSKGYGMSATRGVITKEREIVSLNLSTKYPKNESYYRDYTVIRTDAAINEGNSGGALFNRSGEIVAIVNSKAASDGVEGMGYALPASNVKRLYRLMKDTYATSGFNNSRPRVNVAQLNATLGVKAKSSSWNQEKQRTEIYEKVYVEKADGDLKEGDLITAIKITNGSGKVIEERPVTRSYHVTDTLLSVRSGYTVTLTVSRGEEQAKLVNANYSLNQTD